MDEVGAMEVFRRDFCGGTRKEAAAEGGGRRIPFPGRGGAGIAPNVGGFRRGGFVDTVPRPRGGGGKMGFWMSTRGPGVFILGVRSSAVLTGVGDLVDTWASSLI